MSKKKSNTCYVINENSNSVTFYLLNYLTNANSNQVNYKSRLSHELLKFLNKDVNTLIFIDISSVEDDLSFMFNEFVNHFSVWFPKRIEVINRNL
jgi:hypothetical protein